LEGDIYPSNKVCSAPGCTLTASERHHLWRRSFLAGDFWWVLLPDGSVVGNVLRLCHAHHHQVTDNRASIELRDGLFFWTDDLFDEAMSWQPPFFASMEAWICDSKPPGKETEGEDDLVVEAVVALERCPTCNQRVQPKVTRKNEPRKVRKTWSISVPVAEQEDGAEVLDTNLETIRERFAQAGLPYGDEETVRYYVLSAALALFLTHSDSFLTTEGG